MATPAGAAFPAAPPPGVPPPNPTPPLPAPGGGDPAAKKYDRQLRVWGAEGQAALAGARVCLLGSCATGAEALKNLVLGGIAAYTVIDDALVTPTDLGNNFLVSAADVGRPRAAAVAARVAELNPTVAASFAVDSPADLAATRPGVCSGFSLVIAAGLPWPATEALDAALRAAGVPLVVARSYGLAGFVRPCVTEHVVVESRPDNKVDDLRLATPWPELATWAAGIDLSSLDDVTHRHVPAAALVIQACEAVRGERAAVAAAASAGSQGGGGGGAPPPPPPPPLTPADLPAVRAKLASWRRPAGHGGAALHADEENFDEAADFARRALAPPDAIPSEIRALLADPASHHPTQATPDFWVLVAALRAFIAAEGQGCLPLEGGALPDQTSTTDSFVALSRLYRGKADADAAALAAHAGRILISAGRAPDAISTSAVRTFCRNARNLRAVRPPALAEAWVGGSAGAAALGTALSSSSSSSSPASTAASFLVLTRAADGFAAAHGGRFPGGVAASSADAAAPSPSAGSQQHQQQHSQEPPSSTPPPPPPIPAVPDEDVAALASGCAAVLAAAGLGGGPPIPPDAIFDTARCGGGELHTVAAVVGGFAAQEGIKLLTRQFVPVGGVLVFDGGRGVTAVLEGV